jgi:hypothetical protein
LAALAAIFLYAARRRAARAVRLAPLSAPQREEMLVRVRSWVEDSGGRA